MVSKGLSVYSYISPKLPANQYTVEFSVPGSNGVVVNTPNDNFTVKSLEVDSHNIPGVRNFVGKFQWRVLRDNQEVASAFNLINSLTGNLHGGNMISTQHFSPIVENDAIITYGFYDAGHGEAGLTNRDQCYVTISPASNASWMGEIVPPDSPQESLPFSRFVLPAPHDNGMNSAQHIDAVLDGLEPSHIPLLKEAIPRLRFFDHIPDEALVHMLPNIAYGVSVTQKKPISTMLALGARYFEFRPAELMPLFQEISKLPNEYYFQHACIPGVSFASFLEDQVSFLTSHPTEITIVHIRFDNIIPECKKPTTSEIHTLFDTAASTASPPLKIGDATSLRSPIADLRSSNTRLILLILADKYDSWTAKSYATLHSEPILAIFNGMTTAGQMSTDLTILQCQATSQSIKEVLVYSVLASNAATSCLTSTKAMGDMRTLPWIRENVNERLMAERNVVVLNDFIDGATVETCVEASRERFKDDWVPQEAVEGQEEARAAEEASSAEPVVDSATGRPSTSYPATQETDQPSVPGEFPGDTTLPMR